MCGRYTLGASADELAEEFGLVELPGLEPRYNIAPTQDAAVVTNTKPHVLQLFHWGLIPSWAKDPSIGNRLINARVESLADKPSFRTAYRKRRCLILADGFYEWKRPAEGARSKGKQPMYVRLADARPFAFAGLWEAWRDGEGNWLPSCTIVTTPARGPLEQIHDRMPFILPREAREAWLAREAQASDLESLLSRPVVQELEVYPVSKLVNSPANDTPECTRPLE
jgi:putative SOS response-associated peptidase YedK